MKKIVYSATLLLVSMACGNATSETNTTEVEVATPSADNSTEKNAPQKDGGAATSHKETYIELTMSSGPLKGTHRFLPKKGDFLSQINFEVYEGVGKMSGQALVAENNPDLILEFFTRPFDGAASLGAHEAHHYTKDCGLLKFRNEGFSYTFQHIRGEYLDCTTTTVQDVSAWKEGPVKKRRGVLGYFKDRYNAEVTLKDGSTSKEAIDLEMTVNAIESILK